MRIEDFFTKRQYQRGKQIDKVYEYFEAASSAYSHGRFAKATNTLRRLRDYLNSLDLPMR